MSEIDKIKENISYLKFWLGILVVSDIGLATWFINQFDQIDWVKGGGAITLFILFGFGIFRLHKRIKYKIEQLEDL